MIFYDQLGCGQSDRPNDPSLWTADRYFHEVDFVRDGVGLKKFHLIGHSWRTTVAVGFAAKTPMTYCRFLYIARFSAFPATLIVLPAH
ncbi:MAG: alpha/beta fold hydrolase [Halobacteriota archaeon]